MEGSDGYWFAAELAMLAFVRQQGPAVFCSVAGIPGKPVGIQGGISA